MHNGPFKDSCDGMGVQGEGVGFHRPAVVVRLASGFLRRAIVRVLPILVWTLLLGCSAKQGENAPPKIDLLAVLPVEPARVEGADAAEGGDLPAESGLAVTAQIYHFLAVRPDFRFVPDLTIQDIAHRSTIRDAADLTARAVALGKDVSADAVIFGTVSRFRERVGTEWGATSPAAVSFELGLVEVASGEVLWQGSFDRTQEPLTSNFLNFWMFWRAGPHWFSARELAGLGVDKLLDEMTDTVRP